MALLQAAAECISNATQISLTRDVPSGLGWLIGPSSNIPRESLRFTLTATRHALLERSSSKSEMIAANAALYGKELSNSAWRVAVSVKRSDSRGNIFDEGANQPAKAARNIASEEICVALDIHAAVSA